MNEEIVNEGYEYDALDTIIDNSNSLETPVQKPNEPEVNTGIDPSLNQGFLPDGPGEALKEAGKALVGGAADAVDSVGSFLDLSGDTILTGMNKLFGTNLQESNDITSSEYKSGAWWDIPDEYVPENHSGLGNLVRGLTEFGVLSVATGGFGAGTGVAMKASKAAYKAARLAGYGKKGSKFIAFIPRGAQIASEGAVADLISNSSESANIANLVADFAPFMPFTEALAVDPEKDSSWTARLKTVAAGAGVNLAGHFLAGYVKAAYRAVKEVRAGKTIDQANLIANKQLAEDIEKGFELDEKNFNEIEAYRNGKGYGLSNKNRRLEYVKKHLEEEDGIEYENLLKGEEPSDIIRQQVINKNPELDPDIYPVDLIRELAIKDIDELAERVGKSVGDPWIKEQGASLEQLSDNALKGKDPFVDAPSFSSSEKASIRPDADTVKEATGKNLEESLYNSQRGDTPSSASPIYTETALKKLTGNNKGIRTLLNEVADEISEKLFREQDSLTGIKRRLAPAQFKRLILDQAEEIQNLIVEGKDAFAKGMADFTNGKSSTFIHYMYDPNPNSKGLYVATPATRHAMNLVILNLAKQIESFAIAGADLPKNFNKFRQADEMYDLIKVLMIEQKKSAYVAGLTLLQNKNYVIDSFLKESIDNKIVDIVKEVTNYTDELKRVKNQLGQEAADTLMDIHRLSGGVVRHYESIHNYLLAKKTLNPYRMIAGTNIDGNRVRPRINEELASVYYNSLLSAPKTFVKAVVSTNMIAVGRPIAAYFGAILRGNHQEAVIAAAMLDSTTRAAKEGLQAFGHNWDLAVNKGKKQTYAGKFDVAKDLNDWKKLNSYYSEFADAPESMAHRFVNMVVGFNTSPFSRYSTTIMGSGDALARTIIGRHEMRMRAARKAIDDGVDIKDIRRTAAQIEENFRDEIFTKVDNQWVVTDQAASLAGNEAALTTALPNNVAVFQRLQELPVIGQLFFPFMRTGYNALRLTFSHTFLEAFTKKYDDIVRISKENPSVLRQYGIRPEDAANARAMMEGRILAGTVLTTIVGGLALTGGVTGSLPEDRETRELWRANKIQPNSFKIGDTYVSYRELEPFNTLFALAADIVASSHTLGQDRLDDAFQKLIFMFGSVLVDKSMLAGADDLVSVFDQSTSPRQLQNTIARFARGVLPYSGLSRSLAEVVQANKTEANNIKEMLFQNDVVFKATNYTKYDILNKDRSGKPYIVSPTNPLLRLLNFVSPIAIGYADGDPVKEALLDIGYNIPQELSYYNGEPLTSREKSELQRLMATDVQFRKNLEQIISQPSWKSAVEEYRRGGLLNREGYDVVRAPFYQVIREEFIRVKARAMQELLNDSSFAELKTRVQLRKARSSAVSQGYYDQINKLIEFPK